MVKPVTSNFVLFTPSLLPSIRSRRETALAEIEAIPQKKRRTGKTQGKKRTKKPSKLSTVAEANLKSLDPKAQEMFRKMLGKK